MTRAKGEKRLTIGSRAVAVGIMQAFIDAACQDAGVADSELYAYSGPVAEEMVRLAWDVEYKPTAERLVITIDAGVTGSDKMRSTPEDRGPADPVAGKDYEANATP